MKIPDTFKSRGQRYTFVDTWEHETRDGRLIDLLVFESECPECGESFRLMATKTAARHRELTRRCPDCRAPGVPVTPRRAKLSRTSMDKRQDHKTLARKSYPMASTQTHAQRPPRRALRVTTVPRLYTLPEVVKPHPRTSLPEIPPTSLTATETERRLSARREHEALLETYMFALGMI